MSQGFVNKSKDPRQRKVNEVREMEEIKRSDLGEGVGSSAWNDLGGVGRMECVRWRK